MALPPFKAAGTFTAGTGAITPPYPAAPNAPVAGDIALLVCESENEAISLSSAQGFVELGAQANTAAGTAAVDPASRLAVYWKRCVGSDTAPTVADSGNHTTGQIYLYTGCIATGDPWDVYAEGNDGGANDLTGVIPGATTTVADCLIVLICSSSYNGTSTTEFSAWTNGDLANIVERGDNTNTAGYGGGHGLATGEKATAGSYGNTTVTLAHTSYKGAMSIALKPSPDVTVPLTGVLASALVGIMGAALTVALSGVFGTGSVGIASPASSIGLAGVNATGTVGTLPPETSVGLTGEGVLAATGTVIEAPGSAGALIGAATLWQKPQVSRKLQVVAGLISGSGGDGIVWPSWGTTGGGEVSGAAALGGQGALAAVGSYVHAGASALSGNGTLAAVGAYIHQGAAGLSGEGIVAAAGARLYAAQSALSGEGTIVAAPRMDWAGKAALTGEGVLAATGSVGPEVFGAAALGGQGTLAAVGSYLHSGASALGGNGTLAAVGTYLHKGAAALTGEGTVVAAPRMDWAGKATLGGAGTVTATGALEGAGGAPSVSEYLKECWEDTFRPLLGKKPWPFRVR